MRYLGETRARGLGRVVLGGTVIVGLLAVKGKKMTLMSRLEVIELRGSEEQILCTTFSNIGLGQCAFACCGLCPPAKYDGCSCLPHPPAQPVQGGLGALSACMHACIRGLRSEHLSRKLRSGGYPPFVPPIPMAQLHTGVGTRLPRQKADRRWVVIAG